MIKRVVPPMSNEIITLVKDTSLARIIAAYELTFAGAAFMKSDGLTWPLFYTGVFIVVLAFIVGCVIIKSWRIANENPILSLKNE